MVNRTFEMDAQKYVSQTEYLSDVITAMPCMPFLIKDATPEKIVSSSRCPLVIRLRVETYDSYGSGHAFLRASSGFLHAMFPNIA